MKIEKNIDQLLAAKMEGFEAQAPAGAWEAIQANLPVAGPASVGSSAGTTPLVAAKSVSILGKLALLAGSIALVATTIYLMNSEVEVSQTSPKVDANTSEKGIELTQVEVSTNEGVKAPVVKSLAKANVFSTQSPASVKENTILSETPTREDGPQELVSPLAILSEPATQKEPLKLNEEKKENVVENEEPEKQTDLNVPSVSNPSSIEKRQPKFHNAFSPDGDGKNDTWFVELEEVSEFHLGIYNVKGQLVFESSKLNEHWNGNNDKNGEPCESGNYAFIINYKYKNETKMNTSQGIIVLFR